MKVFIKSTVVLAVAAILTTVTGCKKLLVETPRAQLYPSYFSTAAGVQSAITGVYNDLRGNNQLGGYSGEGLVYMYDGTDENIPGSSAGTNPNLYAAFKTINSSNSPDITAFYVDINTLNGVLQYATAITDVPTRNQYIAQAKFLRGFIYFWLVQTYGGVTATQKSGVPLHTTFITAATTADAPAQLSDLYALIIQDFTDAAAGLPNTVTTSDPFSAGGVGKTGTVAAAQAYLAKAYLTRAYTEAKVTTDFQKAADLTAALITNKATYGLDLWQDYADEHKAVNDYGKENLFAIDYGITDPAYSGYTAQGSGGYGTNMLYALQKFNYFTGTGIDNYDPKTKKTSDAVPQTITGPVGMLRDVYNGRPYIRLAPNKPYIFDQAFADQIHDCRYDVTFQTYWICDVANVAAGLKSDGVNKKAPLKVASNVSLTSFNIPLDGDTAILMPSAEANLTRRDAFSGLIVSPKQWNNTFYPSIKKFEDPNRTAILDFSGRPIVLMRFSEVYLMNAEANYMLGNTAAAATSLNVIRQRASYRTPTDGNFVAKNQFSVTTATQATANATNFAAMALTGTQLAQLAVPNTTTGTTPNVCGMDLILDEYTREFNGDPRRWYDLVRTQQLVRRNQIYNSIGGANVQAYHARWPIPQSLINNVLSGPAYPQTTVINKV